MKIPLSDLDLSDLEKKYAKEAIDSGWISSSGDFVKKAEAAWARYCGVEYCSLVTNGTSALHLALMCIDLKPGDEVIVPGMTFVSPAAVVARMGAVPVLADVEETSWCIDASKVESLITDRTKVLIAVDVLGHPADYDPLKTICRKHGLHLIEDAAEAHGSKYKGERTGRFGDISTFSFFANKTVACGEGGAVITPDPGIHAKAEILKNHGMDKNRPYWHEVVGDNFRMTNVVAAILLGQIERADEITANRKKVSDFYREELGDIDGIELRPSAPWADVIPWIEAARVLPDFPLSRDEFVTQLRLEGIDARALWTPLIDLPPYKKVCMERDISTPRSKELLSQLLWLPTSSTMTRADMGYVVDTIRSICKKCQKN